MLTIDVSKYLLMKHGEPYDCWGLVHAVREELGLKTVYTGKFNGKNAIHLLKINRENWVKRDFLHRGEIGDVILTSEIRFLPYHHCGVVISDTEMIHMNPGSHVTAMRISDLFYNFPGGAARYFYES